MPPTDAELLALQASSLFAYSRAGRMLHVNDPGEGPAPRVYIAGAADGNVIRFNEEVGEVDATVIETLANEALLFAQADPIPPRLKEIREVLAETRPAESMTSNLIWAFPGNLEFDHPAKLVRSGTSDANRLLAGLMAKGMPLAMVEAGFADVSHLWTPWCVALEGREIASIAFSARLGERCAEVGLHTMHAFRGRGLGAAAAAGWATHPEFPSRTLFYSTSPDNLSSQRVTERLGLRFIGVNLQIF